MNTKQKPLSTSHTSQPSKTSITLILAAGKSTRFPGNKLFTPLLNQTLLHYTIKKALKLSPTSTFLLLSPDQKKQEENLLKSFPNLHIMYQENANFKKALYKHCNNNLMIIIFF